MKTYIENTIKYYDDNYEKYYKMWNEEFLNNYNFDGPEIFLKYVKPNGFILDFGCGSGRDSLYFKNKNYKVKAIDGSKNMCELTSKLLDEKVEQVNFLDINYVNEFDGIFACASLLHLNNEDLINCLEKLIEALKPNGVIYASFKYGVDERMKENRFFNDMTKEKFVNICKNFNNIKILKSWKTKEYDNHLGFINFIIKKI